MCVTPVYCVLGILCGGSNHSGSFGSSWTDSVSSLSSTSIDNCEYCSVLSWVLQFGANGVVGTGNFICSASIWGFGIFILPATWSIHSLITSLKLFGIYCIICSSVSFGNGNNNGSYGGIVWNWAKEDILLLESTNWQFDFHIFFFIQKNWNSNFSKLNTSFTSGVVLRRRYSSESIFLRNDTVRRRSCFDVNGNGFWIFPLFALLWLLLLCCFPVERRKQIILSNSKKKFYFRDHTSINCWITHCINWLRSWWCRLENQKIKF